MLHKNQKMPPCTIGWHSHYVRRKLQPSRRQHRTTRSSDSLSRSVTSLRKHSAVKVTVLLSISIGEPSWKRAAGELTCESTDLVMKSFMARKHTRWRDSHCCAL